MSERSSATVPPEGPDDHVMGEGPGAILYLDLACPACARAWPRVRELPLRLCFRHFPMAAQRPRSPALHAAAEATAAQGAFWEMVDSLFADRGRVDDPHLWERAHSLGIELERFNRDRRSAAVGRRVRRDVESGLRAGIMGAPAAYAGGRMIVRDLEQELTRLG